MNTPTIKAVLFDLDGTLLDTALDFTDVVNTLLRQESQIEMSYTEVRGAVSHGSKGLIETAFKIDETDPSFEPLRQRLLDEYLATLTNRTRPFEGIDELLALLAKENIAWGVVTNKPILYTAPILSGLKLNPATTICPDHVTHTKPHPESIQLACRETGCEPSESIVIGDHLRDIEAGKNAGAKTIAAAYGYLGDDEKVEDWQADQIAHTSNDLVEIVKKIILIDQ
jgi:2-phosphoglycolate phosphatase